MNKDNFIILAITSVVTQNKHCLKRNCVLYTKTLEEAKYYLKIMFDVSNKYYKNGSFIPIIAMNTIKIVPL